MISAIDETNDSAALLKTLRENCARAFGNALAMPARVYTSEAFLALELRDVFRKEWSCVGRASALATTGDYLTAEIDHQPILVIRGHDGTLRAYSNVCLHRMSLLLEGRGNVKRIVCPYHAWCYTLDGALAAAPLLSQQSGFVKERYRLPSVRCETWQGWIYVTLNDHAPPVEVHLAELTSLVAPYGMSDYVETFYEEHIWDSNWKILAENFMESYHLPTLHRATVGLHSRVDEMVCPEGRPAFNYHWITKEASLPIGNAHPNNLRLQGRWRNTTALIAVYPAHLITLTPGYFWYLILQPRGVGRVHIRFGGGLAPEFMADPRAAEYQTSLKMLLDAVNAEDRHGVEAVFRGAQAPLATPGHLSPLERPNYDFARYLADRLIPS